MSYGKVKNQLTKLCRQDRHACVTTMIDFYGLPVGFPGMGDQHYPVGAAPVDQVTFLEQTLAADINESNFIPYFMLHEYEAILFCGPEKFRDWLDGDSEKAVQELTAIRSAFASPEDINNNPQTAPSKRIQAVLPRYKKTLHGPIIAADIGLDAIRRQCRHFDHWLKSIKSLAHS